MTARLPATRVRGLLFLEECIVATAACAVTAGALQHPLERAAGSDTTAPGQAVLAGRGPWCQYETQSIRISGEALFARAGDWFSGVNFVTTWRRTMDRETKWTSFFLLALGLLGMLVGSLSLLALQQVADGSNCQALCAVEQVFADMVGPRTSQLLVGVLWLLVGFTFSSAGVSVWRNR